MKLPPHENPISADSMIDIFLKCTFCKFHNMGKKVLRPLHTRMIQWDDDLHYATPGYLKRSFISLIITSISPAGKRRRNGMAIQVSCSHANNMGRIV